MFVQYRGKASEHYAKDLHQINAPCRVIFTLRKLKTVLLHLNFLYGRCLEVRLFTKLYVLAAMLAISVKLADILQPDSMNIWLRKGPVKENLESCQSSTDEQCINILAATHKGESYLLALEDLCIREIKPEINTKDEFKSRELIIKV